MNGAPKSGPPSGIEVRPLQESDIEECERLCLSVHGFERTNELRDALKAPVFSPFVAVRDGRLTAYATTLTFFPAAYGVAETEDDLCALIAGVLATGEKPASFLLPTRQGGLCRWCLHEGMRPVKPMTYMSMGEYRQPDGAWIRRCCIRAEQASTAKASLLCVHVEAPADIGNGRQARVSRHLDAWRGATLAS